MIIKHLNSFSKIRMNFDDETLNLKLHGWIRLESPQIWIYVKSNSSLSLNTDWVRRLLIILYKSSSFYTILFFFHNSSFLASLAILLIRQSFSSSFIEICHLLQHHLLSFELTPARHFKFEWRSSYPLFRFDLI